LFARRISTSELEDILGKVNGNGSSIHLGLLPSDLAEMTGSQLGTMMPNKEREESIPSLVTDACAAALRAFFSAAQRGRWADKVSA
jgi:hypothetical protein